MDKDQPMSSIVMRFQVQTLLLALLMGAAATGCDAGPDTDSAAGSAGRDVSSVDLLRGQRLLAQYQCGSCHAIPGIPAARGLLGPDLQAFGKRSYIAGRIPNRNDALARWIVAPASLVPDTLMPSMGVSPSEARDMAAYLGTLD